MTDKIGNYGLNLEYKGKYFSLDWDNPELYNDNFAEILGSKYIIKRFDLKDVGNISKKSLKSANAVMRVKSIKARKTDFYFSFL